MKFVNLTQHALTEDQVKSLIDLGFDEDSIQVYPDPYTKQKLTFEKLPSMAEVREAAWDLAYSAKAKAATNVMIGGAPYLMRPLEEELEILDITYHYAFTERKTTEKVNEDGTVEKTSIFVFAGWI